MNKVSFTLSALYIYKNWKVHVHVLEEQIRCVFDDNWKIFCQFFIKTYVVGAH